MFERPTVFIVGAGASKEVNFPMGSELTRIIGTKLHMGSRDGFRIDYGDMTIVDAIRRHLEEQGIRDGNPHFAAGRAIAAGMSQAISIDNYLHAHADDEEITFVGKLGIAASILEAERKSKLAFERDGQKVNLPGMSSSWYTPFFQMLTEGVQRSNLDGVFDNVSFITFNYDRCIEHYLLHGISNYFRIDLKEAQPLVNQLRIEHPYGQVGRLPWQTPSGSTSFGKDFHSSDLPKIAGQIRTFTERVEDGDMIARAKRLIAAAEVVVYLGFSYGDMNMDLLSLDHSPEKAVFGTSLGLSEPNKAIIKQDIVNAMGPDASMVRSLELADMTCNDFLYAYWRPILRG